MKKTIKTVLAVLLIICTFFAVPVQAEPLQLNVVQKGENFVQITWPAVKNADGYALYRGENGSSQSQVKFVSETETNNYGLVSGTEYVYSIKPYYLNATGTKIYMQASENVSIRIGVKTPEILEFRPNSSTSVFLAWSGDDLADSYSVYRSTDGKNWTLVKRVGTQSTICYNLTPNGEYYFRIRANRTISGVERYSGYSNVCECVAGLAKPQSLTAAFISPQNVEIRWEPVANATGYRLYRAEDGGEFSLVKTVVGNSTVNYGLKEGTDYNYRIAAICDTGSSTIKSEYSDTCKPIPAISKPENVQIKYSTASGVSISWDSVDNADSYRLYRTEAGQNEKLIKTISENVTVNYGLAEGGLYTYSVKAMRNAENQVVYGEKSNGIKYFHKRAPEVSWTQNSVNECSFAMTAVDQAEAYRIYKLDSGVLTLIAETEESALSVPVDTTDSVFAVCAVKQGYETEKTVVNVTAVIEADTAFSLAEAKDKDKVSLAWQPANFAAGYEVEKREADSPEFVPVCTTQGTSYVDTDVNSGVDYIYRYRVRYKVGSSQFNGKWSEETLVSMPAEPVYRALLIGQYNYTEVLSGTDNDVAAMGNMLNGLDAMNWQVVSRMDAGKAEIINAVHTAFDGASEDDVSLFYYSGHGVMDSGDYYAGALVTVNYEYLPIAEMADILSAVPGKVVVILDSCGSGAAIYENGVEKTAELPFDPKQYNDDVINSFKAKDTAIMAKSGEFRQSKFYVITASAYEQSSNTIYRDGIWGGIMTRALVESVGYGYKSGTWSAQMPGDTNGDLILTLNECYSYCNTAGFNYQDAKVYPLNSNLTLFFR